ncbi:MAG: nucleoside monophosphate kinase [bacterium]|nr:nucleoside monophosphate kinase [bacterium]
MNHTNPITVAFFGISGSGKGTQCTLLHEYLEKNDPARTVVRPEMGNLLRDFMQKNTSLAKHTNEIVSAGRLVPSFITVYLLTDILNKSFDGTQHIILDGTCRRSDQSRAADEMMRLWGRNDNQAIVLKLTEKSARSRLVARGRSDDATDEALKSRFAWYEEHVVPSIEELRRLGWTIHEIDGEPSMETIHNNILVALGLKK